MVMYNQFGVVCVVFCARDADMIRGKIDVLEFVEEMPNMRLLSGITSRW